MANWQTMKRDWKGRRRLIGGYITYPRKFGGASYHYAPVVIHMLYFREVI